MKLDRLIICLFACRFSGFVSFPDDLRLVIHPRLDVTPRALKFSRRTESAISSLGEVPDILDREAAAAKLRSTGAIEQNMHFCLGLASPATVIDTGQILYTTSIEELQNQR